MQIVLNLPKSLKPNSRRKIMANEPVAWHYPDGKPDQCTTDKAYAEKDPAWTPMYYKHEWVGLTDEEKNEITWGKTVYEILELAEAKFKEKNT
jgi:hypothetical protein